MAKRPLVVCPLAFEARLLARSEAGCRCAVACSGPGAAAIERWASAQAPEGPVILCGLAGALREAFAVGSAWAASAVLDESGRRLEPPLADPKRGAVLSSSPRTLSTPAEKRAWAEATGADLVDLESAAFARAAAARGWQWGVVRGVSDSPRGALPPGVDDWVDDRGRTRLAPVLRAVAARRVRAADLRRLRDHSAAAMRAAAELIRSMLPAAP